MVSKKEAMGPRGQGIGRGVRDRVAAGVLSNDPVRDRIYNRVLDQNTDPEWQMTMLDAMDRVPVEHLQGLRSVTNQPWGPTTWKDKGYYFSSPSSDVLAAGLYQPSKAAVVVHKTETGAAGRRVAVHEIGHHQDYTRRTYGNPGYDQDYAWTRDQVANEVVHRFRGLGKRDMALMGMTDYGGTNISEFMSEAYEVWHLGTDQQWGRLSSFVDGHTGLERTGTPSFSGIFGVAGGD